MLKDVLYISALSLTFSLCAFAAEESPKATVTLQVVAPVSGDEIQGNAPVTEEVQPEALTCGHKIKGKGKNGNVLACCGEDEEENAEEVTEKEQQKVTGCGCKDKDKGKKCLLSNSEEPLKETSVVDEEQEELACIKCGNNKHRYLSAAEEPKVEVKSVDAELIEEEVQAV